MELNLLKFGLVLVLGLPCVFSSCDEGWIQFKNYCLAFSPEKLDWYIAASMCKVYDARLVQVDCADKHNWIVDMMKSRKISDLWTGASNRYHNSVWKWVPSRDYLKPFCNWAKGEPNNNRIDNPTNPLNAEQCMHIWGSRDYKWNDKWCGTKLHFVCEKECVECSDKDHR